MSSQVLHEYLLAVTSERIAVFGTKVFELSPLSNVRSNRLAHLNVESGISPLCLQIYFCTNSYNCLFTDKGVEVFKRKDASIVFMGQLKNKLYLVDFSKSETKFGTCLVAKSSMGWL